MQVQWPRQQRPKPSGTSRRTRRSWYLRLKMSGLISRDAAPLCRLVWHSLKHFVEQGSLLPTGPGSSGCLTSDLRPGHRRQLGDEPGVCALHVVSQQHQGAIPSTHYQVACRRQHQGRRALLQLPLGGAAVAQQLAVQIHLQGLGGLLERPISQALLMLTMSCCWCWLAPMLRAGSGTLWDTGVQVSLRVSGVLAQLMHGQPSCTARAPGVKHGSPCLGLPALLLSA